MTWQYSDNKASTIHDIIDENLNEGLYKLATLQEFVIKVICVGISMHEAACVGIKGSFKNISGSN